MLRTGHGTDGDGFRRRLLALSLAALLALPSAVAAQDGAGGAISTGDPDADALIAEIERVTTDAVEAQAQLRSEHLDPEVLLDRIGRDPAVILEWVSEQTRWLPYEGALRGAGGVLMDRSGSSLDRALLLADLLERSGLQVRLANATLDADTAASLAAAALEGPRATDGEAMFATPEELADYRAQVAAAAEELASQTGLLTDPAAESPDPAGIIADHWWVQAETDGTWTDHDPLLGSEAATRPLPEWTVDPADLPAELQHSTTLRVIVERAEDGAPVEEVPLEHTTYLANGAPLESMDLSFSTWVPDDLSEQAAETESIVEGARLAAAWRPRLAIDDQTVSGEWFSESGVLGQPSAPAAADALSSGLDALGGLGADVDAEDAAETALTAAWIELETAGPGLATRTERRELLDLLDGQREATSIDDAALASDEADLERGLAFLGQSAFLLQASDTHPDAYADAYLDTWIELRPALIAMVFLGAGVEDERIAPSLASPTIAPVDLIAMAVARDGWPGTSDAFVGRPQVWAQHLFFDPQDLASGSGSAVDIVMNDVAVVPDAEDDPRLVRLEQGLLDTLVEHVMGPTGEGLNTWDRYAQRQATDPSWTVLTPDADPGAMLGDTLPAADLARISDALQDGDTVVVAAEPRYLGDTPFAEWWRISDDGSTLGMGYRGWGQDTTEEASITQEISLEALKPLLEADRVANSLWRIETTAKRMRAAGRFNPYAHLSVFADTLPIITVLVRTLPMWGGI